MQNQVPPYNPAVLFIDEEHVLQITLHAIVAGKIIIPGNLPFTIC